MKADLRPKGVLGKHPVRITRHLGFVKATESEVRENREQRFFAFLEIRFGVSKKQGICAKSVGRCRGALHGKRR